MRPNVRLHLTWLLQERTDCVPEGKYREEEEWMCDDNGQEVMHACMQDSLSAAICFKRSLLFSCRRPIHHRRCVAVRLACQGSMHGVPRRCLHQNATLRLWRTCRASCANGRIPRNQLFSFSGLMASNVLYGGQHSPLDLARRSGKGAHHGMQAL
jgi:hypothetical protein